MKEKNSLKNLMSLLILLSLSYGCVSRPKHDTHCLINSSLNKMNCHNKEDGEFDIFLDSKKADKFICVPGTEYLLK